MKENLKQKWKMLGETNIENWKNFFKELTWLFGKTPPLHPMSKKRVVVAKIVLSRRDCKFGNCSVSLFEASLNI